MGLNPEEIQRELPHLNLAQMFDALAFYLDNRQAIDRELQKDKEEVVSREYPAGKYWGVGLLFISMNMFNLLLQMRLEQETLTFLQPMMHRI